MVDALSIRNFQSRPDLQGVKTFGSSRRFPYGIGASKADPIFRGSKRERKQARFGLLASKADPIFRGSKRANPGKCVRDGRFQSRPDLQGVKTGGRDHRVPPPKLLNQTRSSAGKTRTRSAAPAAQSPTETKAPHVTPRPRSRSNARRQAPPRAQASRRQNPRRPKSDSQPGPRLHAREPRPSARHMPQRTATTRRDDDRSSDQRR